MSYSSLQRTHPLPGKLTAYPSFLQVTDPSLTKTQRKWLFGTKIVLALFYVGFIVVQIVLTTAAYRNPSWSQFYAPVESLALPQILLCPQWESAGDPSCLAPNALVVQNCSFWDGVQTDWWSGKCEPQRVIAHYFGVPLHCLLYNGGDMPITVQGGYGLIKFAVALNYTTHDDGTQFLSMYYHDPAAGHAFLNKDLDLRNSFGRTLVPSNHKVVKKVLRAITSRYSHISFATFFQLEPPRNVTTSVIEVESTSLPMTQAPRRTAGPTQTSQAAPPLQELPEVIVEVGPYAMQLRHDRQYVSQNNIYTIGVIGGGFGAARLMYRVIKTCTKRICARMARRKLKKRLTSGSFNRAGLADSSPLLHTVPESPTGGRAGDAPHVGYGSSEAAAWAGARKSTGPYVRARVDLLHRSAGDMLHGSG